MIYSQTVRAVSGLFCGVVLYFLGLTSAHAVFINEIHYDNISGDVGEGIELSGEAGIDLAGWSLVFYSGDDSSPYSSASLYGEFMDMQNGMGVLHFEKSPIQNGGSDGISFGG